MTRKTKAKVMTRKQKKEANNNGISEEEALNKIEFVEKEVYVSENAVETITEKLLLIEMNTMKAEELRLEMERKGLNTLAEMNLVQKGKNKDLKPSTKKLGKLMDYTGSEGILLVEDIKLVAKRQCAALDIIDNLILIGHKNVVENSPIEIRGRLAEANARAKQLWARIENVSCKNEQFTCKASCKNPSCQKASLHRCSRCLLVSYCSLQCSHLCWQEHKHLCDKEAAARKVKKVRRREKRAVRKFEKVGTEAKTVQEVD